MVSLTLDERRLRSFRGSKYGSRRFDTCGVPFDEGETNECEHRFVTLPIWKRDARRTVGRGPAERCGGQNDSHFTSGVNSDSVHRPAHGVSLKAAVSEAQTVERRRI